MRFRKLVRAAQLCAGVAFVAVLLPSLGFATPINYGDYTAANVIYQGVTESSVTNSLPVYGSPSLSVNTLSFDLNGAGAFNIRGQAGGFDFVDGQLVTTIAAKPTLSISQVSIQEEGDFSLFGLGTTTTKAAVGMTASLRIRQIDGQAITPIIYTATMPITPSSTPNGAFNLVNYPGIAQSWQGLLQIDVNSIIQNKGLHGKATLVDLSFDNALLAYSEIGSGALIVNRMVDVGAVTAPVPEPGTLVLLGIAAFGLIGYIWRRRSK